MAVVIWDVMPCGLLVGHQYFGEKFWLHFCGRKMSHTGKNWCRCREGKSEVRAEQTKYEPAALKHAFM
jgi:hypothetical protein